MANFKEKLLGLIDSGASTALALFDNMNETINSIDWDAQFNSLAEMKESLIKRGNELVGEFNELMKQVKNNITDFEVVVPFDASVGENFKYELDGNNLIVEVEFKNETTERLNKTTVVIPQNCDVEKITTKHDQVKKTMTVVIPKVITEPKGDEENKENGFKLSKMATPKKKPSQEESHQAESKLLKKFRENQRSASVNRNANTNEVPRGANGRFVKRNPKI